MFFQVSELNFQYAVWDHRNMREKGLVAFQHKMQVIIEYCHQSNPNYNILLQESPV